MKQKNILVSLLIATSMCIFISCGGDDSPSSANDCNNLSWTQQIQDEITTFSEAGAAYGNDPTLEKCEIWKDAARDYVEALQELNVSCITGPNEEDYREALADAQDSVEEIDCSQNQGN